RFRTLIAYISIKENRLFIAITHPGAKMELNYNKDLFKSLLAMLNDKDSLCSFPKIEQITTYIPKFTEKATLNTEDIEDTVPRYDEKSTANFDITTTDTNLKKAYDDIKKAILCNIQ
ncbi:MAG: hypothetical protein L0Y61_07470, partial [Epsilonproteobacteria bacterium]|nr:hypothetical protein [Campylobacterota bacterium]